jgi:hypothetical protein
VFDPALPCIDVLPPTKTDRQGITFHPASRRLVIEGKRSSCVYVVREIVFDVPGRAFQLAKVDPEGGSDPESDSYTVTCGRLPKDTGCSCRGYIRWSHCRHLSACWSLIENRWI